MRHGRWLLLLIAVFGFACGTPESGDTFETKGRIGYDSQLEGGWWYIRSDSGETFTPKGSLPAEFQVPGMQVQATLIMLAEVVSPLPGPFVHVVRMEQLAGF